MEEVKEEKDCSEYCYLWYKKCIVDCLLHVLCDKEKKE